MVEMAPFKLLISREEALKKILGSVRPVERIEVVPIEGSSGRVLAENIVAQDDVPPFDRAAMDGYAVKAEDTYGASQLNPITLKIVAVLHAGESTDISVSKGECIRIATGCRIPKGSDAVVMVEFTEEIDGKVVIKEAVHPRANISPKGEDMKKGESVIKKGDLLTPAKVGVLAALGRKTVTVYQKPRVAVVPTGTEICEPGSTLKEGQIYDVNSYTLSSVLSESGAQVTRSPVVPDSIRELKTAVKRFLDHDLIVFSGGSSVGECDLLVKVIEENGKVVFHGVQIKPGKPTLFGLVEDKPIIGMPGYPTSCLSNAYIFLVPAVRKMARLPPIEPKTVKARMGNRFVSGSGREQFLPVKILQGKAYPVFKKSGDITSLAQADGYIILPVNLDVIETGEEVIVTLF
ncbi:MAG: molybdopterin-binding protein [Candidatus Bathyarchaeia archaeon]